MKMSKHAQLRRQQRGIRSKGIQATLLWGQDIGQYQGRRAFYLGRRQVDWAKNFGVDVSAFERTAVIQAEDGTIVTVIRTSRPSRLRRWRMRNS